MSLEKYGPPERGSGTWTDGKRKGRGGDSRSMENVGEKREAGGGMNEKKGGRKKRVIEREREERCWQSWKNRVKMGRDGVWRGVAKLMVLSGEIVVNQSSLNKSSRPRRIFKKCLFN